MSSRSALRLAPILLTTALLVVGQLWLRSDSQSTAGTVTFLVGAMMAALFLARRPAPALAEAVPARTPATPITLLTVALGAILLAGGSTTLYQSWQQGFYVGWALLVAGTALLSTGMRLADGRNRQAIPWSVWEAAGLAFALAIGAFLRFHEFADFPGAFATHAIEEQQTGLGGTEILAGVKPEWEFALDYQLTALALWLSDSSTFNTIRVPFTLASLLTIVPVHLLFRQLFRPQVAVAATALFSVLGWNLVYSRCAHPIFLTNGLVVAVMALLIHFGRTHRRAGLPWIGLLTGYTLYSYAGYRGTALFVFVFLGGVALRSLWVGGRRGPDGRDWWTVIVAPLLVLGMVIATALPIAGQLGAQGLRGYYFEAADRALANEVYYTDDTGYFIEQRIERVRNVAKVFMHRGDGSYTFNSPGRPMLDPIVAVLFVTGLLLALLRPGRRYAAFFLFMLLVLLGGGTIFVQNLDIRRLQGITVLILYFAALAIEYAVDRPRARSRLGRWTAAIVLITAVAGVFGWSYRLYFVDMAGSAAVRRAFRDHYTGLIQFGRTEQPREIGLLSIIHRFFDPGFHYRANYAWLIDSALTGRDLGELHDVLEPKDPTALPPTIVIQSPMEGDAAAEAIMAAYPAASCHSYPIPENPFVAMVACDLPEARDPLPVISHLKARYWFSAERTGPPAIERSEPFIGYVTVPKVCYTPRADLYCSVEWRGKLRVPDGEEQRIYLERIGRTEFELRVDGRRLPPGPTAIAPGEHTLLVTAKLPRDWETGVRLSWWREGRQRVVSFLDIP